MSDEPFFIIGSGRSGSTLLRLMLASHSRIGIPPETWYLLRIPQDIPSDRPLTPEEVDAVVRTMTGHYRWPDMKFEAAAFRVRVASLDRPDLRSIIEAVYKQHLEPEGKVRWGDKTPGYIEIVPRLSRLFPEAKFIHIFRDGRDVARSYQVQGWYGRGLSSNSKEWMETMAFNEHLRSSVYAGKILQLRYEDLVADPEATVRRICDFLEEKFEPGMLHWQERIDELVPEREAGIHGKLRDDIDAASAHRWKRSMTFREVFVCESIMGDHLRSLGYELRFDRALWRPALRLSRWYFLEVAPKVGSTVTALRRLLPQEKSNAVTAARR